MVALTSEARLVVQGRALEDTLGRRVLLRGVNTGGRSKWAPFAPFDFALDPAAPEASASRGFEAALARYMDVVASFGVNVVRMPFSWEAVEPQRGHDDEAYLQRYTQMIDAAWRRGMRVLVDFHQDIYATPFSGDGFPLWTLGEIPHGLPRHDARADQWFLAYMEPDGPVQRAFDRLWSNADGLLDAFEAMWRRMARRLGARPGVIGFEVINEPGWGSLDLADFESRVLTSAIDRVGRAILEEAPDTLVFCGGPGADALTASTALRNPSLDRFVYAPHYYDVLVNTGGPYQSPAKVRKDVERLSAVGASWDRPVFFGEFGASRSSPDHLAYLRDVYAALDATQAHGTLWEVSFATESWNHEDFGVTRADGTEHPLASELVRAYPRAIDGVIDRFAWDPAARRFDLEVSSAGPSISEVFLPKRHLGERPRIEAHGAHAELDGSSSLLLLKAATPRWSLVVSEG